MEILNGIRQHTLNEEDKKILEKLWAEAQLEIEELEIEGETPNTTLRQRFFALYTEKYESPFPTSLFYDTGLDFSWSGNRHARNESSPSRASVCSRANLDDSSEDDKSVGQGWIVSNSVVSLPIMLAAEDNILGSNDEDESQLEEHGYHTRTVSWYSARSKISPTKSLELLSTERVMVSTDVDVSFHSGNLSQEDSLHERNQQETGDPDCTLDILPSTVYVPPPNTSKNPVSSQIFTSKTKEKWRAGKASIDNLHLLFTSKNGKSSESLNPMEVNTTAKQPSQNLDASHYSKAERNSSSRLPQKLKTYIPSGTPNVLNVFDRADIQAQPAQSSFSSSDTGTSSSNLTHNHRSPHTGTDSYSDNKKKAEGSADDALERNEIRVTQITTPTRRQVTENLETFPTSGEASPPPTFTTYHVDIVSQVSKYRVAATQTTPRTYIAKATATHSHSSDLHGKYALSTKSNELASTSSQSATSRILSEPDESDQQRTRENASRERKHRKQTFGYDGPDDEYDDENGGHGENSAGHCFVPAKLNNSKYMHNPIIEDNDCEPNVRTTALTAIFAMASNKNSASSFQPEKTAPLRIHKQSKQVRSAQSQQHPKDIASPQKSSTPFPPRESSLRNSKAMPMPFESVGYRHARQKSDTASAVPSTSTRSSHRDRYLSDASIYSPSLVDTARSTVASSKEHYISGSAEIIGNFMPVGTQNMAKPVHNSDPVGNNGNKNNLDA